MPYHPRDPMVATLDDGTEEVIGPDNIYADDHPYVKKYAPSGAFVDIEASKVIQAPSPKAQTYAQSVREDVEQATAAPGEVRRGPGRPRKS